MGVFFKKRNKKGENMRKKRSVKALRKIYLGGGMVPIMNVLTDKSTPKRIRNGVIEKVNKKELYT